MTMRKHSGRAKRLTRRACMLVAALLLADRAWVARQELAADLFGWEISLATLSHHATTAETYGGCRIEARRHLGYRLTVLPPDEHLDSVLACVPDVKRSAWWTTQGSRTRMTA